MIQNEKQYEVTQQRLQEFKQALVQLESEKDTWHKLEFKLHKDAMESYITEFQEELAYYEQLQQGNLDVIKIEGLKDIPDAIMAYMVARKISVTDLSVLMKDVATLEELQEYEHQHYRVCDTYTLDIIAKYMGMEITLNGHVKYTPDLSLFI